MSSQKSDNSRTYLNKLLNKCSILSEGKCFIYLLSKWGDQTVEITLQDTVSNKCYKGELSNVDFEDAASELEIPYDAFHEECRQALTNNMTMPGYEYEIDSDEAVFRLIKKQDFDIQYLEIKLKELKNNYSMLETAIELVERREKAALVKEESSKKDDHNYEELLDSYQQCVEEKHVWKRQMLKKCALILNAKKEKIAELQGKIQNMKNCQNSSEEENGIEEPIKRKGTPTIISKKAAEQRNTRKRKSLEMDPESEEDNVSTRKQGKKENPADTSKRSNKNHDTRNKKILECEEDQDDDEYEAETQVMSSPESETITRKKDGKTMHLSGDDDDE